MKIFLITLLFLGELTFAISAISQSPIKIDPELNDTLYILKPKSASTIGVELDKDFNGGEKFKKIKTAGVDSIYLEDPNGKILIVVTHNKSGFGIYNLLDHFWSNTYLNSIKKKYGASVLKDVLNRRVRIGWNKELCELSWGTPNDINKTVSSYGTSEQWVYSSNYLYFEKGIVTTIQN